MAYKTLMVHLALVQPNTELLRLAGDLAKRFDARIVGIAACQPLQLAYGDGYTGGSAVAACQDEFRAELRGAEAQFHEALKDSGAVLEWRSSFTTEALPYYLASEARCADLILTGSTTSGAFDSSRHASIGDLVMQAGRPVVIVPEARTFNPSGHIVVAWKDTREARRAATEALPLLALAERVTVAEITDQSSLPQAQGRVEDVAAWLALHQIKAVPLAVVSDKDDASQLDGLLAARHCDLVVAGAYGHNRLREWAFGGVTHNLLQGARLAMLSH